MTTKTKAKVEIVHEKELGGYAGPCDSAGCGRSATDRFRVQVNACDAYIWVCPKHAEELA